MSSGHSPGDFCTGFCSCGDLFSETDNELSMQHAYPVHQEISDEILPMHYGRTFTRERKKSVKPAQLSSIRDLTQLNVLQKLGGGFQYSLFSPLPGEDSHFDSYWSKGLKNHIAKKQSATSCKKDGAWHPHTNPWVSSARQPGLSRGFQPPRQV